MSADKGQSTAAQVSINPAIFKAYDVRGLYPQEVNEEAARLIGRGFVTYLNAKRIAVSRDMRVSSPTLAAAFIEGALAQGCDVVDCGILSHNFSELQLVSHHLVGRSFLCGFGNASQQPDILLRKKAFRNDHEQKDG